MILGRLVKTHSTYLDGLITVLNSFSKESSIKTVVPGVIGRVKGKNEGLSLRVSRQCKGGYRVIGRLGRTFQEIYVNTELNKIELQELLNQHLNN